MKAVVKEFIEATIIELENKDYHEMFTIWYNHFVETPKSTDRDNLVELFSTYEKAGLDVYKASETAREDIIYDRMYNYMDDILLSKSNVNKIELPEVIKALDSDLEVGLIRKNELFKHAAKMLSNTYDITIQPFKILRK